MIGFKRAVLSALRNINPPSINTDSSLNKKHSFKVKPKKEKSTRRQAHSNTFCLPKCNKSKKAKKNTTFSKNHLHPDHTLKNRCQQSQGSMDRNNNLNSTKMPDACPNKTRCFCGGTSTSPCHVCSTLGLTPHSFNSVIQRRQRGNYNMSAGASQTKFERSDGLPSNLIHQEKKDSHLANFPSKISLSHSPRKQSSKLYSGWSNHKISLNTTCVKAPPNRTVLTDGTSVSSSHYLAQTSPDSDNPPSFESVIFLSNINTEDPPPEYSEPPGYYANV